MEPARTMKIVASLLAKLICVRHNIGTGRMSITRSETI